MFQYNHQTVFSRVKESVKIFFMLAVSLAAITFTFFPTQALLFAFITALLLVAGYKLKDYSKLVLSILPFLIFINVAWLVFFAPYRPNIVEALAVIDLRIFIIFFNFAFFSLTTDLIAVVELMKKLHFPESIYLATYIVLRFLPELERDFRQVLDWQKLKGITWKQPRLFFQSLFLPLIYLVFERSDELTVAYFLRERRLKQKT